MEICNLIGGEWVGAIDHATFETRNPARADEVLAVFPSATAADAAQAVAAAAEAFPAWAATPAPARGAILFRAAELLADRMATSRARSRARRARRSPRRPARSCGRATSCATTPARAAAWAATSCRPTRPTHALQPAASRSAWWPSSRRGTSRSPSPRGRSRRRSPTATPSSQAGRATPLTALRLVECLADAGLPDGVLNLVTGAGSVVGGALVDDPRGRGHHLHRLGRHRPRIYAARGGARAIASSSRWAARTPSSCSTTPTSGSP